MLQFKLEPHICSCRTSGDQIIIDGDTVMKLMYVDEENGFIDNKLVQYNEKKQNSVYEHEGTFSSNINDSTISFAGNIDNPNSKVEELIKLNYSHSVNFPITYKKINASHAFKFSDISKRYFGIDEDEIGKLLSTQTNTSLDISNLALTQEEKEKLQTTYLTVIKDNLEKSSFTKVTTTDGEGYSLEISNEKFKEILVKLLETLKDDELMLDKISKVSGSKMANKNIETIIDNINANQVAEGNSTITVYQSKEKLNKIEIQYNDEFKISIAKTSSEDEVSYDINFEDQKSSVNFKVSYTGLQALEEVNEKYELNLNLGENYTYNIENTVDFSNSDITISNFATNEYINLASIDQEKANKLFETISQGIIKVNTEKSEEAGVKGTNPFIAMIPGINETLALFGSTENEEKESTNTSEGANSTEQNTSTSENEENKTSSETNNTQAQNTETNTTGNEQTSNATNNESSSSSSLVEGMEKVTKESFNEKFKQYEGNNVKGPTVKSLIMQVIANNMIDDDDVRKIEVTGDIVLTGTSVPDSIDSSKYYVVKCSTDSDGYVNKVDIKLK